MSIWERYSKEQQQQYIQFLQVYGALTRLFYQKSGALVPYLDSKFQETVFARVFGAENIDIGNTPHDVLAVFGDLRVGIGLKTWVNSKPSFQKVMQLKSFQSEINALKNDNFALALKISEIKNERMLIDYNRLGLSEDSNIYHYITRDAGIFTINECAYPLVNTNCLHNFTLTDTSFSWSDGLKNYKYTFGDSTVWQKFGSDENNTLILNKFNIKVLDDPFDFLLKSYLNIFNESNAVMENDIVEAYLPLYSYQTKDVELKSGLNAWNAAPKNKHSGTLRPLNEIYIPVPIEFHRKFPNFFRRDILDIIERRKTEDPKPEVRFHFQLPNGKRIPALLTGSNLKNLQSGSSTERDRNGRLYGQDALGQWLLVDTLGLKERVLVTREWLLKKGTDSIRLWRKKNDYDTIFIDFAPVGAFESFMDNEPIEPEDNTELEF